MRFFDAPSLLPVFPEIFLALMALVLLVLGVLRKEEDYRTISNFSIFTLIAVGVVACRSCLHHATSFDGTFIVDQFAAYTKILVIVGAAFSIFMADAYATRERIARFEYPVLVLFATLGMMLMISANGLMTMYVAIELLSLPLYVLAAIQRDTLRSTEAGLKYFILGALSSGLLLYGASLLYGYTGTTHFDVMARVFAGGGAVSPGIIVGMVMLLSGLAFKIGAVPFHMWAPDVYEGAPTSVTAFFAIAPKVAGIALLVHVFMGPFLPLVHEWQQVIAALSIASMVVGAVAALVQINIKRMLAYSSIGHMGYALIGLVAADAAGINGLLIYIAIYMVMSIGTFAIVLMMKRKDIMVEKISDLAGLSEQQPMLALAMTVMMFSMAGIPPLAGFFGKLFIFQAAIGAGLYALAIIGVLSSVVAAFYYIRIIKIMYFDAPADEGIDIAVDGRLNFTAIVTTLALLFFIAMPGPLLTSAQAAVDALLQK